MHKRLQIHVLENIADNGGWQWTGDLLIYENPKAAEYFQHSDYSPDEYATVLTMLVASGKVVAKDRPSRLKSPECLTVEGLDYLEQLKHPRRTWFKRNAFAATVAVATMTLSIGSIAVSIWIKLSG